MKTKTLRKTIIKHKEMTGKVIGISEEKQISKLKLLLDNWDMEIKTKKNEFKLGDNVELDVDVSINNCDKKKS